MIQIIIGTRVLSTWNYADYVTVFRSYCYKTKQNKNKTTHNLKGRGGTKHRLQRKKYKMGKEVKYA